MTHDVLNESAVKTWLVVCLLVLFVVAKGFMRSLSSETGDSQPGITGPLSMCRQNPLMRSMKNYPIHNMYGGPTGNR